MIYLLYGSDTQRSRIKLRDLVDSLIKKKPDASHVKITDETFDPAQLQELAAGMGLFESRAIVEMDRVFRNETAKEFVLDEITSLEESNNIFVFLEAELDAATLKKFEKAAEKVQEFSLKEKDEEKSSRFNMFSLTDAYGRRDRKQLWVLYTSAKMSGVSDEEIHGILFWQAKVMIQAILAENQNASGLKPFVYQKSLTFSKNFTPEELKKTSSRLVSVYHDARRGITELDVALEKLILEA